MGARQVKREPNIQPALLTLPEAAKFLGVSLGCIRGWVYSERSIPSVRLGRGAHGPRRIRRVDLERLIEARTEPALRVVPGGVVAVEGATRVRRDATKGVVRGALEQNRRAEVRR